MAEGTLENVAGSKPLGKKRKRKKLKIIIGEAAKHPTSQIGPREQTIPLRNIGQRGGDPSARPSVTITDVVPRNTTSPSIRRVDPRSRRR